jgi:hypothetical protein
MRARSSARGWRGFGESRRDAANEDGRQQAGRAMAVVSRCRCGPGALAGESLVVVVCRRGIPACRRWWKGEGTATADASEDASLRPTTATATAGGQGQLPELRPPLPERQRQRQRRAGHRSPPYSNGGRWLVFVVCRTGIPACRRWWKGEGTATAGGAQVPGDQERSLANSLRKRRCPANGDGNG